MKKILCVLMICLSLVMTKPLLAGTCEGGEEFQGAVNGHTYCRSNSTMTWWAAFEWCKKQGRKLASMNQLCIDWAGGSGNLCPNMVVSTDNRYVWSSNPHINIQAVYVVLSSGYIGVNNRSGGAFAVCY